MADVFLSYERADAVAARAVVERLAREGWTVFWDRDIAPGQLWSDVLEQELAAASCVLALWTTTSVESYWVKQEAVYAAEQGVLVPARLQTVDPPFGARLVHACDLTTWDRRADASELQPLVDAVADRLSERHGVTLVPLDLAIVLGRPSRHPDLAHTVNLSCELRNGLDRDAVLRAIEGTATTPGGSTLDLSLRLYFDVHGGEHVRRTQPDADIVVPAAGARRTGIQLSGSLVSDIVRWPAGQYDFTLLGWVDRDRRRQPANLHATFAAELDRWGEWQVAAHAELSDAEWQQRRYSDDAVGIPLRLRDVRPGPRGT